MKKIILLTGLVLAGKLANAQTEKWGIIAIKEDNKKELVVSQLKTMIGIRYIAYCPNHQLVVFKYNTDVYANVDAIYNTMTEQDNKMSDLLIQKTNASDENMVKEIINYCDFDKTNGEQIKQEIQN